MKQEKTELTPLEEFNRAANPLIDYLKSHHPHTVVIVDSNGAQLMEGLMTTQRLTEEV